MAIVKKYKSVVLAVENKAEGVYTVTFAPESGKYRYSPGQFLHLAIDNEYDGSSQWPESRCFSLQSSPDEEVARITYAVKGNFTRDMEACLTEGCEVWLKMPYGDLFEQEHDKTKTVFISGGTGITPFLSLFTHDSFAQYHHPVLYAGFRDKTQYFYQNELLGASSINAGFSYKLQFQDTDGMLDIDRILNEQGTDAFYFISGPPVMIKLFKEKLISGGLSEKQVLTDDWE